MPCALPRSLRAGQAGWAVRATANPDAAARPRAGRRAGTRHWQQTAPSSTAAWSCLANQAGPRRGTPPRPPLLRAVSTAPALSPSSRPHPSGRPGSRAWPCRGQRPIDLLQYRARRHCARLRHERLAAPSRRKPDWPRSSGQARCQAPHSPAPARGGRSGLPGQGASPCEPRRAIRQPGCDPGTRSCANHSNPNTCSPPARYRTWSARRRPDWAASSASGAAPP